MGTASQSPYFRSVAHLFVEITTIWLSIPFANLTVESSLHQPPDDLPLSSNNIRKFWEILFCPHILLDSPSRTASPQHIAGFFFLVVLAYVAHGHLNSPVHHFFSLLIFTPNVHYFHLFLSRSNF